jgi:hypothetical protein
MAAKPSHVVADVDRLACCLYRPTVYSGQMREKSILIGTASSHRAAVGGAPFRGGGVRGPQDGIFDVVLTIRVP